MFSLWKYQVQKERESTVSNDGSQSVKRRRTLSTRCLVQFTHAGGDGGGDLPHHPYFFSRAAAKKLFLLDYQVRVVAIELHSLLRTLLHYSVESVSTVRTVQYLINALPPAACRRGGSRGRSPLQPAGNGGKGGIHTFIRYSRVCIGEFWPNKHTHCGKISPLGQRRL